MSFASFLNSSTISSFTTKNTIQEMKENPFLKTLAKHVRGGISSLTKQHLLHLNNAAKQYKENKYPITPDPEQNQIIEAPTSSNIRIIAGAGTGKTTTIGCRIKFLLDTVATPDKFLILTFNIEARKNLELMMDKIMGFPIKLEIRTIDSFCNKIRNNPSNKNESLSELGIIGRSVMEQHGATICSQYKYVFFDEFQDVDANQFFILSTFVKHGCFLTVIGDDSQNIYQFRGSDNYYIINYDKIIPNTLSYKITTNYRSTQQIIAMANKSITFNQEKIPKEMRAFISSSSPSSPSSPSSKIDLTISNTESDTYTLLISQIKCYLEAGHKYQDFAILARNTKPLKIVETELEKLKIPYVALIADQYSKDYKQIIQEGKIVLSTIHKSKGLEWPIIFIVGLCDQYFPTHMNNGLKNIEEERRLFYVAITRAKYHIHFMTHAADIPLCRFLGEVRDHLTIIRCDTKGPLDTELFCGTNETSTQKTYSVTKVIELLSGPAIQQMKQQNLIPTQILTPTILPLFPNPLTFTNSIKQNVFESDYGIFCDLYTTRQLMIQNSQKPTDAATEKILLALHFTDEERQVFEKYNILQHLISHSTSTLKPKTKDKAIVNSLIKKILQTFSAQQLSLPQTDHLLKTGISDYHYPPHFMIKLKESYKNFQNINLSNNAILESIYYVSLCAKFNDSRRRLLYRDVQDMYQELSKTTLPRINEYTQLMKDNKILCKLAMDTEYKINNEIIYFGGELDYFDITTNTIVDIKCSESEYKLEWLIQLLLYYALSIKYLNPPPTKLAIFNIFSGSFYEFDIPPNYDHTSLLSYVKTLIQADIQGDRKYERPNSDSIDFSMIISSIPQALPSPTSLSPTSSSPTSSSPISPSPTSSHIHLTPIPKKSGFIVLDVENNVTNLDIVQVAYMIYDNTNVKQYHYNQYVKSRAIDSITYKITGITTQTLETKGIPFLTIMTDLYTELNKVKFICGHYVHTDIKKIKDNLEKYNITVDLDITKIPVIDTAILYKKVKNKKATLPKMYQHLFNKTMQNHHDALADVEITALCFIEMLRIVDAQNRAIAASAAQNHALKN